MTNQSSSETITAFRFSPRPNHAHEIQWMPWGEEAFQRATAEGKPILLAISAFWCHWCHVMDETTYSDPAVIELINRDYVPVRVDTDQRPDINRRYNQGGWPTVAFLTPTGEILSGATYVPPQQFVAFLSQINDYFQNHRGQVQAKAAELRQNQEQAMAEVALLDHPINGEVVEAVSQTLLANYDPAYGGFGRQPKFPHIEALELALELYHHSDDAVWGGMVTKTLEAMRSGGMYDPIEGGFFRYSTTRDWGVPHYEKMLEDNAQLAQLYLRAGRAFDHEGFLQTAREVLAYMDRTLRHPGGGFFGSQDANEEYYPLDKEGRAERKPPKVDPLIYTDRCALAASAFLAAYRFLGEHSFLHRGFVAVDFLWSHLYREGSGMLHYWDGSARQEGLLSDQVAAATALLDAYEATANPVYLQHAIELAELVKERFCDTQGGGFFDRVGNLGAPGAPPVKELSENAQAAFLYLRLATLIGLESYRDLAESALRAFLAHYQAYGIMAAGYARAIDHYLREPVAIRIVGELHHPQTRALWQKSLGLYALGQFVQMLDPIRDSALISQLGLSPTSKPVAYICLGRVCLAPISASEEIQPAIRRYLHERRAT